MRNTPADIRVEFENIDPSLPEGKDGILLNSGYAGYPFGLDGIVYLIVKTHEKLENHPLSSNYRDFLVPEIFATELIKVSSNKETGVSRIGPATRLMLQQYDETGYCYGEGYKYICSFKIFEDFSYGMTLTISDGVNEYLHIIGVWKKICDVAQLVAIAQHESMIILNDSIPCNECVVRVTCVVTDDQRGTFVNQPCDLLKKYKEKEVEKLSKKLPDWSVPFVFDLG